MQSIVLILAAVAAGGLSYGWFEAGWLRTRVLEVFIDDLPEALDGVRIGHLSDFHFGAPFSRGNRASAAAVAWIEARRPDVVCVTGDLVSHPRGEPRLRPVIERLETAFVVLGNHDIAVSRDPFVRAVELRDLERVRLLRDDAKTLTLRGVRVSIVGVDPMTYRTRTARPDRLVEPDAAFRLLLCHFPTIVRRIPAGSFDLVLAGHHHAGQITVPLPGRPIALAHPRAAFVAGLYDTPAGLMHVSPGTGTSLLPFRFFARPEVTELILRRRAA